MNKMDLLGWVVAASLAGILFAGGFQVATEKTGVVDIVKIAEASNLGKEKQAAFEKERTTREGLMAFMDQNRVIAPDQATRLRELWLKAAPTAAETAELERIKSEAKTNGAKLVEFQTKSTLTPEDRTIMDDYTRRAQQADQILSRWFQEFGRDMQSLYDSNKIAVLDAARATAKEVGRVQGCTIVFDASAAPFGSNDLTDATLQALNAKK